MAKRFGAMLDMSRNAVMRPDEVKKFASVIKSFGYNMIMLYTEDTYEVDGETVYEPVDICALETNELATCAAWRPQSFDVLLVNGTSVSEYTNSVTELLLDNTVAGSTRFFRVRAVIPEE